MEQNYIIQSTNNISKILRIMELHEENISNTISNQNTAINSIERHISSMISNREHLVNYIINNNNNLFTICNFESIVEPINITCPITQQNFNNDDIIIKINVCGHIFIKDDFLLWLTQSDICPCCRVNFLVNN